MEYAGETPGGGPKTRTAWAGVLFHDAGNDGQITEGREFAVTEWDPTAWDDGMALRDRAYLCGEGNQEGVAAGSSTAQKNWTGIE